VTIILSVTTNAITQSDGVGNWRVSYKLAAKYILILSLFL